MSERAWPLEDVDPSALERAAVEAARRGVSLGEHLGNVMLQHALAEQVLQRGEQQDAKLAPVRGRNRGVQHQIESLGSHLAASAASLDATLIALDLSLSGITGRVSAIEARASNDAEAVGQELRALRDSLLGLRLALSQFEDAARISSENNDVAHATLADACGELERRVDEVDALARGADHAAAQIAEAQHGFRRAIAKDLEGLSRQTIDRVRGGLDQMRAAAEAAAAQADAAAARQIAELHALRRSFDERLATTADETKSRMHAVFAEASGRLAALSDRVSVGERQIERLAESVRARIDDAENGAEAALEETALALRRADAVLGADIVRVSEASRAALAELRDDFTAQTTTLNERQLDTAAHLGRVETEIAAVREQSLAQHQASERRFIASSASLREAIDEAEIATSEQFDAAMARSSVLEQDIAHVRRVLGSEIERVEACTLAALEKQSETRAAGEDALKQAVNTHAAAMREAIEDMRVRVDDQIAALRGQQANAHARLDCFDASLADNGPLATVISATADEIASLRARVMGAQSGAREMAERIAKLENSTREASDIFSALQARIDDVATRAPPGLGERLHEVELALADMRLGQIAEGTLSAHANAIAVLERQLGAMETNTARGVQHLREEIAAFVAGNERRLSELERDEAGLAALEAQRVAAERTGAAAMQKLRDDMSDAMRGNEQRLVALEQREQSEAPALAGIGEQIAAMEQRSAEALVRLHADIAHFVAESERRLSALEQPERPDLAASTAILEQRLAAVEQYDVGSLIAELRARMEERILGVEQRNVRTLEQLSQTIALIELRFADDGEENAAQSA